jgi:hypothetical protein
MSELTGPPGAVLSIRKAYLRAILDDGHAHTGLARDRDGNYSMYSTAVASENYLRGVQVSDAAGQVICGSANRLQIRVDRSRASRT